LAQKLLKSEEKYVGAEWLWDVCAQCCN